MPIYEYVCSTCGEEFEALQKFSDKPLTRCTCGKSGRVERKMSLSAFQLKGGGWYKDLYGAGSSNGGGSNGSSGNGKSNGKAGSSSETTAGSANADASSKSSDTGKSGDSGKAAGGKAATPPASGA